MAPPTESRLANHYRWLRGHRPFAPGALGPIVAHHDIAKTLLRSDDFVMVDRTAGMPLLVSAAMSFFGPRHYVTGVEPPSILALNPPVHGRYRRLVSGAFTARAVGTVRERTESAAAELLEDMAAVSSGDRAVNLIDRYAARLPLIVIGDMLGVPSSVRPALLAWGDASASSLDVGQTWQSFLRAERALEAFDGWLREHVRHLRDHPGDDLLSELISRTDEDGSSRAEHDVVVTAMLLLGAGFETTRNLIGNAVALLSRHGRQRDLLVSDPSWWSNAVDEVLRFDSPVQRTARVARFDTEVEGVPVRRGTAVGIGIGAANRDPTVFFDADRFDVKRVNAREHLAFSSGVHHCLGAALARMEAEVALRSIYAKWPTLALVAAPLRRPTQLVRGYAELIYSPCSNSTDAH